MKTLLLFLSLLLCEATAPTAKEFINSRYIGGYKAFQEKVYKHVNYPAKARAKNRIGKLKTRLYLNEDASIEKVEFFNKLGYGIEEYTAAALMKTKGNWLKADTASFVDLVFAFRIDGGEIIEGDINITACKRPNAFGSSNLPTSSEDLLEKLNKCFKKKKYKKAKKIIEELLRRDPDSEHYNNLNSLVNEKLKS